MRTSRIDFICVDVSKSRPVHIEWHLLQFTLYDMMTSILHEHGKETLLSALTLMDLLSSELVSSTLA